MSRSRTAPGDQVRPGVRATSIDPPRHARAQQRARRNGSARQDVIRADEIGAVPRAPILITDGRGRVAAPSKRNC